MRRDLRESLDEPDHGVRFHPVQHVDTRALEQRPAEGLQLDSGKPAAQCGRDRGGMRVRRWLPCRDVDPGGGHGRAAASGEAFMASATR